MTACQQGHRKQLKGFFKPHQHLVGFLPQYLMDFL
jgi:hypothetical protein